MRRRRILNSTLIVLGSLAIGACFDSPSAPELSAPSAEALLGDLLLGGGPVEVMTRKYPLSADEVVSKTIGISGGTIYLPKAGLTVTVPYGAVSGNTAFKVTAPKGNLVGYHFEPSGMQFNKSLTVKQDLSKTNLNLLEKLLKKPVAAYFQGELKPIVNALEILGLNLSGLFNTATFYIKHFSGYVIATD